MKQKQHYSENHYNDDCAPCVDRMELRKFLPEELRFWLHIMKDHATFIRGGLDPSEEMLIRKADQFAMAFEKLEAMAQMLDCDPAGLNQLIKMVLPVLHRFIMFKKMLYQGIKDCRILAILPADLILHITFEALFFDNILHLAEGLKPMTREQLGIPDNKRPALTVPARYIALLQGKCLVDAVQVEILFWAQRSFEHAEVLAMYTRPVVQEEIRKQLLSFVPKFMALFDQAKCIDSIADLKKILPEALQLAKEFACFLENLAEALKHCDVPTGQMNAWPTLVEHIFHETEYFVTALEAAEKALHKC